MVQLYLKPIFQNLKDVADVVFVPCSWGRDSTSMTSMEQKDWLSTFRKLFTLGHNYDSWRYSVG